MWCNLNLGKGEDYFCFWITFLRSDCLLGPIIMTCVIIKIRPKSARIETYVCHGCSWKKAWAWFIFTIEYNYSRLIQREMLKKPVTCIPCTLFLILTNVLILANTPDQYKNTKILFSTITHPEQDLWIFLNYWLISMHGVHCLLVRTYIITLSK